MTRSELVADLATAHPHLQARDIEAIVSAIFDEISQAMAQGARVELRGFGAFSVKRREARIGRNPRTGAPVRVFEKTVPFFKVGKELRERINSAKPGKSGVAAKKSPSDTSVRVSHAGVLLG